MQKSSKRSEIIAIHILSNILNFRILTSAKTDNTLNTVNTDWRC